MAYAKKASRRYRRSRRARRYTEAEVPSLLPS